MELIPHTQASNIVGYKWIFRTKYNLDGTVSRLKARLVAKGFTQRPGVDYVEIFSHVLEPKTLIILLSLDVSHNWFIKQLNINNVFLQGTLTEIVFMAQPPRFLDINHLTHVCKLTKAISGLKQACRAWYDELKNYILSSDFHPNISDPSLFQ